LLKRFLIKTKLINNLVSKGFEFETHIEIYVYMLRGCIGQPLLKKSYMKNFTKYDGDEAVAKKMKQFLSENRTASCTMISEGTGIPQKTLCYRKRALEKEGSVMVAKYDLCKVTGRRVQFLTLRRDFAAI
jgi:hypothetical protein